jgi:hypothetical protein
VIPGVCGRDSRYALKTFWPLPAAMAVIVVCVFIAGANAAESDLDVGLAYLRAGAQRLAVETLRKYRNEEKNPDIRKSVDRVLPLLETPLPENVREYIATNLEEHARAMPRAHGMRTRPSYWSRMFPVFP